MAILLNPLIQFQKKNNNTKYENKNHSQNAMRTLPTLCK